MDVKDCKASLHVGLEGKEFFDSIFLGITVANVILIVKAFRSILRNQFESKAKWLILILLTSGDIFLTVFAVVVQARFYLRGSGFGSECSIATPASTYQILAILFVYWVILVMLIVEFVFKYRNRIPREEICMRKFLYIFAFVYSSVPWIIGLVVVLPLIKAGIDWESCCLEANILSKMREMYGLCICMSASAAMLVYNVFILIGLHSNRQQNIQQEVKELQSLEHNLPPDAMTACTTDPNESEICVSTVLMQYHYPTYGYSPLIKQSGQFNLSNEINTSQEFQSPCRDSPTTQDSQPLFVIKPPIAKNLSKEKNILILVYTLYFCCMINVAVFYWLFDMNPGLGGHVQEILWWLLVFRSFITPIIWIGCSLS